jgi:DNA-binding transcriptional MerR regulator
MHTDNLLSIKQVCKLTGLVSSTLRFWEKEFEGLLLPLRTMGGQRRYSSETLFLIKEIKKKREQGFSLPEIKRLLMTGNRQRNTQDIELLADRVAEIVKVEIYNYLTHEK